MTKKAILIFVLFIQVCSAVYGASLQALTRDSVALDTNLFASPFPNINMARGFIGVISRGEPSSKFHLLDSHGNEVFQVESEPNIPFYYIDMQSCDSIIILAACVDEGLYHTSAYDYRGNQVLKPIEAESPLEASPGWKYLHTTNNTFFGSSPILYDCKGNILAEFSIKFSNTWELTAINDTMALLRNGSLLQLISPFSSAIIREVTFAKEDDEFGGDFISNLSPDHDFYATARLDKITVWQLSTGKLYFARFAGMNAPVYRDHFFLTTHGEYLLLADNRDVNVSLMKRGENEYVAVGGEYCLDPTFRYEVFAPNPPLFEGNLCPFRYFTSRREGTAEEVDFRSYVFDYIKPESTILSGMLLNGYAAFENPALPGRLNILSTGVLTQSVPTLQKLEIQEVK